MTRTRLIVIAAGSALALLVLVVLALPKLVPAAALVRGTAAVAVYASGTVEAIDRAEVRARASGPLVELLVREGDPVKRGQLLARIDAPALRFDVARGKVDRDAARIRQEAAPQLRSLQAQEKGLLAQAEQARADLARIEGLVQQGIQPPQELERARTAHDGLEAQLEANRAQQRDVRILLQADTDRSEAGASSLMARAADADIRAPIDGVVLVRRVERGETVLQGQSLLRIGDLSHLQLEALVDEADVGKLAVGIPAAVRLLAFDDRVVTGRVVHIAPEADREHKAFEVDLVLLDAPAGLRPGMTAEVNLIAQRKEGVLLAPVSALSSTGGASGAAPSSGGIPALRVLRQGRVRYVQVRPGVRDLGRVEVDGALSEGELVVLGEGALDEGQRVRPDVHEVALPAKTPAGGLAERTGPAGPREAANSR